MFSFVAMVEDANKCFICGETLPSDLEAVNNHIDGCLNAAIEGVSEGGSADAQEDWEEYTWAGQTRVRATAMLEGGYAGK